jgi:mannose-6-phosphate isomerase-like protein (cupin superfamily)
MDAFELTALETQRAATGEPYLEFLRVPALSVGLYTLDAGAVDGQRPHTEDEVYVVMTGRARITVADEVQDVGPGSVVYVAATVQHRFHDITERLEILVVFAPAEYSLAATSSSAKA